MSIYTWLKWAGYKNTIQIAILNFYPCNHFKADTAIVTTRMHIVMVLKIFVGASQRLNSSLYHIQYAYNIESTWDTERCSVPLCFASVKSDIPPSPSTSHLSKPALRPTPCTPTLPSTPPRPRNPVPLPYPRTQFLHF